jgi:hypothetical protein
MIYSAQKLRVTKDVMCLIDELKVEETGRDCEREREREREL